MTQRERQLLNWIEENPLISQQELADKAGITRSSVAVHISNLMKKGYITGKGYIVHTAPYVTVVGGVNMDIGGWPGEVPVMQDSNPGVVRMSLGGVGRNIAHNMALLGMDVRMLTVFGDDINAQKIAASCGELGIDISQSPIIPEGRTSTYLFITDEKGDMALAVSDMEIYKHLTPQMLSHAADPAERQPGGGTGHQHPRREHPVPGGPLHRPPVCRPGVHRQGGEAEAGAGQAPHPEAQPHRSRIALRREDH